MEKKKVRIIRRGIEKEMNSCCFEVEIDGKPVRVDNCSVVPNVFQGNVHIETESGEPVSIASYLVITGENTGILML